MTTPYCLLCSTPLDSPQAIQSHNASACLYKRQPQAPHHFIPILPTYRLPRYTSADHQQNALRDGGLTDRR